MNLTDEMDKRIRIAGWRKLPASTPARLSYGLHRSFVVPIIGWGMMAFGGFFVFGGFSSMGDKQFGVGECLMFFAIGLFFIGFGLVAAYLQMQVHFDKASTRYTSTYLIFGKGPTFAADWKQYASLSLRFQWVRGSKGGTSSSWSLELLKPDGSLDSLFSVKLEEDARAIAREISEFTGIKVTEETSS